MESLRGTAAIRWSTVAAVAMVAAVAGWVSYVHAFDVVTAHGESGYVARAYPATIDGLIYAASMVLLDSARRGVRRPALAGWMLSAGILITVATNFWAGLSFGYLGAVVAMWPAFALVGSYELLMLLVRSSAQESAAETAQVLPASSSFGGVRTANGNASGNGSRKRRAHSPAAVERKFRSELDAGQVPSIRSIMGKLRVGFDTAKAHQERLAQTAGLPVAGK